MADSDETFYGGDTVIRVEGLAQLVRRLNKTGIDSSDLQATMQAISAAVIRVASPPVRTGTLASTLRAGKGKTKAVVRAGGARAPYAGVIEYGWSARGIDGSHWLDTARNSRSADSRRLIQQGIDDVLKKNDLT